MAAKFPDHEVWGAYDETTDEPTVNNGWFIEVHETNYDFNKRFPVLGHISVGQLIVLVVKEIGKSLMLF